MKVPGENEDESKEEEKSQELEEAIDSKEKSTDARDEQGTKVIMRRKTTRRTMKTKTSIQHRLRW